MRAEALKTSAFPVLEEASTEPGGVASPRGQGGGVPKGLRVHRVCGACGGFLSLLQAFCTGSMRVYRGL